MTNKRKGPKKRFIHDKHIMISDNIDKQIKELADKFEVNDAYIHREALIRGLKILFDIYIDVDDNILIKRRD